MTVEAGVETEAREVGIPEGTQVEIRDLFFNTPARLKFQKTESTEAANVSEAVLRLALGHPEAHFRLRAGGRVVLDLPVHRDLGERVRAAFARRGAGALHEAQGDEGGNQVRAFLAAPEEAATTARSTFLFVGRRFVRDRSLLHALSLGYGELLEKGRYPLAALFLEVPGQDLDVNVHPQKMEVRFARAAEVYAAVRHVVGAAVARAPWLGPTRGVMRVHSLPPPPRGEEGALSPMGAVSSQLGLSRPATALPFRAVGAVGAGAAGGGSTRAADADGDGDSASVERSMLPDTDKTNLGFFQSLVYIGQLHRTYLICEAFGELILIDQHAAHERVAFERLRAAHGKHELRRQRLLFPVPVDLEDGVALGFEIEVARPGEDASAGEAKGRVLLRAVPELLRDADPKPLLRDLLGQVPDDLRAATGGSDGRLDHVLATMACHSVVRAGDVLGRPQALALLSQLDAVDLRSHCPHGRPVLLRLPLTEIERRFGRI